MDPEDAAATAADRADAAGQRARELAERLTRLAAGESPGPDDVLTAQEHAEEEMRVQRDQLSQLLVQHDSERRWRGQLSALVPVAADRNSTSTAGR